MITGTPFFFIFISRLKNEPPGHLQSHTLSLGRLGSLPANVPTVTKGFVSLFGFDRLQFDVDGQIVAAIRCSSRSKMIETVSTVRFGSYIANLLSSLEWGAVAGAVVEFVSNELLVCFACVINGLPLRWRRDRRAPKMLVQKCSAFPSRSTASFLQRQHWMEWRRNPRTDKAIFYSTVPEKKYA